VDWNADERVAVKLINSSGKIVLINHLQFTKGLNFTRLNEMEKLSAGNYFIEIVSAKESVSQKVIK
jgi:hypothetical protein